MKEEYSNKAIELLEKIISIPSLSREEDKMADFICNYLNQKKIPFTRVENNIWCVNKNYGETKKTILLNSHIDTVKPNANYTRNPYTPEVVDGKLYGLGSNDAGASLVSLLLCFEHYYNNNLPFNLMFAASAEEEISGTNGIELLLKHLPIIDAAIVGEPTHMQMAVAENGLLVLDCKTTGVTAHAAHGTGSNAIYLALKDIEWFRAYTFSKESEWLGKVRMQVTQINAGTQHNVVPAECHFVVDVRVTDAYRHEQVLKEIKENVFCEVVPRSLRLKSTAIHEEHYLVKAALEIGIKLFGSHTMSDKALMHFPSVKMGPGDTLRSHIADEYIYIREITEGIETYIRFIDTLRKYF